MCSLEFSIVSTDKENNSIVSGHGRYKKVNESMWIEFPLDLNNPNTPNITEKGNYNLEVKLIDSEGNQSEWGGSTIFEINCDYVEPPQNVAPVLNSVTFPNGKDVACCNNN